jgi:hypothetical protein
MNPASADGLPAPLFSVRNLIAVVGVIAIDFALVHDLIIDKTYIPFRAWGALAALGFTGSLPAASAVAIAGVLTLPRRGRGRPFLTGFALSGAVAVFALMGLAFLLPWDWFIPLYKRVNEDALKVYRYSGWIYERTRFSLFNDACEMTAFAVLFSVPELLIAVTGGLLARRAARTRQA